MQKLSYKFPFPVLRRRLTISRSDTTVINDNVDKHTNIYAEQATGNEVADKAIVESLSAKEILGGLSSFRIQADAISTSSIEPHAYGGKAQVVKATLKRGYWRKEPVAVKKLKFSKDTGQKVSNEFVHEVDVLARLSHKNIVKLMGFVEHLQDGKAWIVLSWEPNGNVSEFLATKKWEIPERLSLIKDTLAGLEYLHTQQPPICHGDLKSLNILVSAFYRAVITDFGSARILRENGDRQERSDEGQNATGASAGASVTAEQIDTARISIVVISNQLTLTGPAWSLRWAAPEVAMGQQQDLASDIWAVGWTCWEIMTNKVPFPELNSEGAITLKVVEGQVPVAREDTQLSQVVRLCNLMTQCWAFNPRDRPSVARCRSEIKPMPSVLPIAGGASDPSAPWAELLLQMGRVHRSGSHQQAIQLFEQAVSTAMSVGDQKTCARALHNLGRLYDQTSSFTEAEHYFTRALDISTQIGDELGQANALELLAKGYRSRSKLAMAEESYARAQTIYSRIGNDQGRANTLRGLGNISSDRSQYTKAEEFYDQARDIYTRLGDDRGEANTLVRLGELRQKRSEYTTAEELFNRALEIYSRISDDLGRANALNDLGHLYRVQGLNTKAMSVFEEARTLYNQVGNFRKEKQCSRWLDVVSK